MGRGSHGVGQGGVVQQAPRTRTPGFPATAGQGFVVGCAQLFSFGVQGRGNASSCLPTTRHQRDLEQTARNVRGQPRRQASRGNWHPWNWKDVDDHILYQIIDGSRGPSHLLGDAQARKSVPLCKIQGRVSCFLTRR